MPPDEESGEYNQSSLSHEVQRSVDSDGSSSPTTSSLGVADDTTSSATSFSPDPHTVPPAEALSYYRGLPSEPTLLYRTSKERWSSPKGPEAQRRTKELCEVFNHPIAECWNEDLGWKVVAIMDDHSVYWTSIDVVRFKIVVDKANDDEEDDKGEKDDEDEEPTKTKKRNVKTIEVDEANDDEEDDKGEEDDEDEEPTKTEKQNVNVSPVTIWVGVLPGITTPTEAHNTAKDVLALLDNYNMNDIEVDFRESFYMREAGPQLLKPVDDAHPLVDVISPLTPALGLSISTKARPHAQGTMALYLAEGGIRNRLLGLSCRHVLIGQQEGNAAYKYNPSAPSKDVFLLGDRAYKDLLKSIEARIERERSLIDRWTKQLTRLVERERGRDLTDAQAAEDSRRTTQIYLDRANTAVKELEALLNLLNTKWSIHRNRVLGKILCSPPIGLGVGEHHFTEDWGIFQVDRDKLGSDFKGNQLDLGTKMSSHEFVEKCFPRGDADWKFEFPPDRLLPLMGTIPDKVMRHPDMWDANREPCLLVVKNGNTTGITIGRATGVFSFVREYFKDMTVKETSMEWAIINYDSKSDVFSKPGDSGSIIADIQGRIGGLLTGGSGQTNSTDVTYATPFWWLLQRIKQNGFPNAHLDDLA